MDTTYLTEEQRKLVEENYNLIYTVVPKIAASDFYDLDSEDIEQTALMYLCEAATEYENVSDCAFSTYAVNFIRMRLFDEYAAKRRKNADYHAGRTSVTDDNGDELDISEIVAARENTENTVILSATMLNLAEEISLLRKKNSGNAVAAKIIDEIIGGKDQADAIRDVSRESGVSYSYCTRVLRSFREKLKEYAVREGLYA